ncbi:MAG: hypothetical protein AAF517_23340, partial [Planctomycetota bacterium]
MSETNSDRSPVVRRRGYHPVAGRAGVFVFGGVLFLMAACCVALGARLFYVQILSHDRFTAAGQRMRTGKETILSARGDIFTRDQVLLARSVLSYEVGLDPKPLGTRDNVLKAIHIVAEVLDLSVEERRESLERALKAWKRGRRYARVARRVSEEKKEEISKRFRDSFGARDQTGFAAVASSHRQYPRG